MPSSGGVQEANNYLKFVTISVLSKSLEIPFCTKIQIYLGDQILQK